MKKSSKKEQSKTLPDSQTIKRKLIEDLQSYQQMDLEQLAKPFIRQINSERDMDTFKRVLNEVAIRDKSTKLFKLMQ